MISAGFPGRDTDNGGGDVGRRDCYGCDGRCGEWGRGCVGQGMLNNSK